MKLDLEILQSVLENPKFDNRKENFTTTCPWCDGREFGISIKLENHPFNCYRKKKCGESGTIFKFLKKIGRLDLIKYSKSDIDYSAKLVNIIEEKLKQEIDLELPTIQKPIGFKKIETHKYLQKRGFDFLCKKYEIGTTILDPKLKRNYIIFLIKEEGEVKGYVARNAFSKEYVKKWNEENPKNKIARYHNSMEADFTKLLGGYDELTSNTKTVILVEGIFKKANIDKLLDLDNQEEIKCLITFSAKVSVEQVLKLQLKGIENIILFFDSDVIDKVKKISADLLSEFETVKVCFSDKDPDSLSFDELMESISKLKDPLQFRLSKVKILDLK